MVSWPKADEKSGQRRLLTAQSLRLKALDQDRECWCPIQTPQAAGTWLGVEVPGSVGRSVRSRMRRRAAQPDTRSAVTVPAVATVKRPKSLNPVAGCNEQLGLASLLSGRLSASHPTDSREPWGIEHACGDRRAAENPR